MDELVDKNSTFGVPRRREEVIEILNACYSSDLLELAEFERRVERANAALTIGDLESVVADVPEAFRAVSASRKPAPRPLSLEETIQIRSSSRTIDGPKLLSRLLAISSVSGNVKLDYRGVSGLPAEQEIKLDLRSSTCKIIVPPDTDVVEEIDLQSSIVRTRKPARFQGIDAARTIRISGTTVSSVVKVKYRKA